MFLRSAKALLFRASRKRAEVFEAAMKGEAAKLQVLLQTNLKLANLRGSVGLTPLHVAARFGRKEATEVLIRLGADVNAADRLGHTPLQIATGDVAGVLIRSGARPDIFSASALGMKDWMVEELNRAPTLVTFRDATGRTALHWAAIQGKTEMVEYLLTRHAEVNSKDNLGETALHLAAQARHRAVAETLISKGAELDIFSASALGMIDQVTHFLEADPASLERTDRSGKTVLHWAAVGGQNQVAKILIEKGAKTNAEDRMKMTALHCAAASGNAGLADILLSHGARSDLREKFGLTPLRCARDAGHVSVVEILQRHGAKE